MSTSSTINTGPALKLPEKHYLNASYGIRSWLLTTDHKRIALLYLASVTFFFFIGGFFAMMIRLHLMSPNGTLLSADTYNRMFTMHGVTMIFFFLIPSIPAVLGNFLIPLMVGAKDLAFPKINLLSWYIYIIGGSFTLYSMVTGGLDTGWTFYTPLSTVYSNSAVAPAVVGVFITGFSSILTGLNFLVTVHTMRAPGMTWFRLPLFVWAHYATSVVMILGTPVIAITLGLAAMERVLRPGLLQPGDGRRSHPLPAPILVLLPPRRVHHDFAGDGRDQRTDSHVRAQEAVRLPLRCRRQPGHCRYRLLRLGAPHVPHRTVRPTPRWHFRFSLSWSPFHPR